MGGARRVSGVSFAVVAVGGVAEPVLVVKAYEERPGG